jgi:uncharacterized protein YlxP (DUF503 family)
MIVGTYLFELHLPECGSLKSKRHVLRSLKDRLRGRYNLSVAEVGGLDLWQRCTLAVATVSNDGRHVEEVLSRVFETVSREPRVAILEQHLEIR